MPRRYVAFPTDEHDMHGSPIPYPLCVHASLKQTSKQARTAMYSNPTYAHAMCACSRCAHVLHRGF